MLPRVLRNAIIRGTHEQADTTISPELIAALLEGTDIRRILEIIPIPPN